MITVCFTGHRPNKLYGYSLCDARYRRLADKIFSVIETIIRYNSSENSFRFITGGALGIDQLSCDIVQEIKEKYSNLSITSVIAVPFKDQPKKWFRESDLERYDRQLKTADSVVYVDKLRDYKLNLKEGTYSPAKMQMRNRYMVDNSNYVISVWDGTDGGTANCCNYADKCACIRINIDPKSL